MRAPVTLWAARAAATGPARERASRIALASVFFMVASRASAQSVSIDEAPANPAAPAVKPAPSAASAAKAPTAVIAPPKPISMPLAYPDGESSESDVELELTISKTGAVSGVTLVRGNPPFADVALSAVKAWTFSPATRDGVAIAAKIRFKVRFTPPPPATDAAETPALELEPRATHTTAPAPSPSPSAAETEVVVQGVREPLRMQLGHAEIHDLPGAFGDPYRAIESLPGVVPIVSGLPYFYVRGAPPGNVGYFFDGIPVPYLYHFAAGPGVLHPGFVDHVDLYPAAYPARFGRFTGAIVAGEMAPPGTRVRGEASVRVIDSGAMVEAPFANQRGSVMLGGRFSYTGLVLSLLVPELTLNYWDYQARVRYDLSPHDTVELLAFGAGDFLSQEEHDFQGGGFDSEGIPRPTQQTTRKETIVDVNFHRLDLRWDHRLPRGNWRNAVLFGIDRTGADNGNVHVTNTLVGARTEYDRQLSSSVELRAGADVLFESLAQDVKTDDDRSDSNGERPPSAPTEPGDRQSSDDPDFGLDRARKDLTAGVRADVVWNLSKRIQVTPGVRVDLYVSGDRSRIGVDPRISARYELSEKLSIVHGLSYVHQAPSFVVPVPGFKPSLKGGLQSALQHSAGINYALPAGFQGSLTVFQNAFFNMTDFVSLVQLQNSAGVDDLQELRSLGHAYGLELMLRRSLARDLGGFLAYTLSRSLRGSGRLEGPSTTDRTHVVNLGLSYNLGRNWRLGGRWLFYSGIPSRVAYVEAAKAPPRTPPFWRVDFKLQKRWTIIPDRAWWGLVLEVLNTTLNKEVVSGECNAFYCSNESIGPVTIPSIGVEGAF
jgi:TonB family protein